MAVRWGGGVNARRCGLSEKTEYENKLGHEFRTLWLATRWGVGYAADGRENLIVKKVRFEFGEGFVEEAASRENMNKRIRI